LLQLNFISPLGHWKFIAENLFYADTQSYLRMRTWFRISQRDSANRTRCIFIIQWNSDVINFNNARKYKRFLLNKINWNYSCTADWDFTDFAIFQIICICYFLNCKWTKKIFASILYSITANDNNNFCSKAKWENKGLNDAIRSCGWTVSWFLGHEISWCFRDSYCALFHGTLVELRNINCAQARTSRRFQSVKHGRERAAESFWNSTWRIVSFVRVSRCHFITS